ncbi:hypothetical protein [Futiania mangrovi]|uniref:Uncharacterized protein n=1 Tax=Futiania mangrovi TaxID=2959716 RepID=A0A9J6PHF0_9PROT|nr:hypothetical protein [Futiania mangrovii]MCP1335999.1 hypothetical protein [Futiania mangrovii]
MSRTVRIAGKSLRVPGSPLARMVLGVALVLGGTLGFLPVLGFWMIPLGLLVLSVDSRLIRRWRRRLEVKIGRRLDRRRREARARRAAHHRGRKKD